MLDLWETDKLNSLRRNRLSPSCFNKEEEQGEEAEALQNQPKLVELRKFLVPLLILRYIESLHFSTTFGNLLPAIQHLPGRHLWQLGAGCCSEDNEEMVSKDDYEI
ncbi:hypothetical protein ILYODFUR_012304 [Ilyodon furcidens]|uniref:Uncharacterized protein n=1 Tax=Ilyodon furcidens TaxID=33524 RepID=A0ABV0TU00_9TELE